MAGDLKRPRVPVSYKEPSSDEDDIDDSDEEVPATRRTRALPQRRSHRIRTTSPVSAPARTSPRNAPVETVAPRNSQHTVQLRENRRVSYRESSGDEAEDSELDYVDEAPPPRRPQRRETAPRSPRKKTDGRPKRSKSRALGAPRKPRTVTRSPSPVIPTDGKPSNWANLPYHVLLQIFVYASHPLHDDNFNPTASIKWLANTALVCTAFVRPALTALYRNPPIFALRQNRRALVHHLAAPASNPFVDYTVMVKRLEIDPTRMSKLTDPHTSVENLAKMISTLKTVKDIDIHDPFDKPPYRERSRRIRRWQYPDELFEALEKSELRLRSWRWTSTYFAKSTEEDPHGHTWLMAIHSSRAFQSIEELNLTKFQADDTKRPEPEDGPPVPTREELLGSALAALPNLKSLTFESCTILNKDLLPLLPENLVSLNITNCREFNSEHLQAFLTTHGSHLEELVLNHNQSLDFSFSTTLKSTCPRLQSLRMDMHYYSTLSMSSDNEPLYDYLLADGEIPTWPSTLRTIDLEFLRNWSAEAAVAFFTSLIDSAENLPYLRELTVTAIVDIDWRKRAEFRKKWTSRFRKVFARRWEPTNPELVSFRAAREAQEAREAKKNAKIEKKNNESELLSNVKRILNIPDKESSSEDSDAPLIKRRKTQRPQSTQKPKERWDTKRLRSRPQAKYDESSGAEGEGGGSGDEAASDAEDVPFVQGLCHTVLFRIDNSRPQETIYDEADFLDTEASGDEDWDGNDVVDEGYAW